MESKLQLNLPSLYDKKKFGSFRDIGKETNEFIKSHREQFIKDVLNKQLIVIEDSMSKREILELLEFHKITIQKDTKKNLDCIYMDGTLIGSWERNRELFFDENGHLICEVKYSIY